jgi:hypothetical protein
LNSFDLKVLLPNGDMFFPRDMMTVPLKLAIAMVTCPCQVCYIMKPTEEDRDRERKNYSPSR